MKRKLTRNIHSELSVELKRQLITEAILRWNSDFVKCAEELKLEHFLEGMEESEDVKLSTQMKIKQILQPLFAKEMNLEVELEINFEDLEPVLLDYGNIEELYEIAEDKEEDEPLVVHQELVQVALLTVAHSLHVLHQALRNL